MNNLSLRAGFKALRGPS